MKKVPLVGLLLALAVFVVGCGDGSRTKPTSAVEDDHSHGPGPHKGTIFDWGGGKYHLEFCMDHAKKEATIYVLDGSAKKAVPISADKLMLSIKEPAFKLELKAVPQASDPAGKASRFVGTHENFGKEQEFAGTVSGKVDGTPYVGDFKEEEHKATKKQ